MKPAKPADVVLVSPPVSVSNGPSLALGLLKALLIREGVSCCVDYADLYFTDACGETLPGIIGGGNMGDYFGDFIFNESAGIVPAKGLDDIISKVKSKDGSVLGCTLKNGLLRACEIASSEVEKTALRILSHNPRLVGVTSCFQQRNAALAVCRKIKQLRPEVITVMGGANCFGNAGLAILRTFPFVDYVFFGESDEIFASVCKNAIAGNNAPLPYGVLRNGMPLPENAPHRITEDLDALPYPDYDDFFETLQTPEGRNAFEILKHYLGDKNPFSLYAEGSRGCWWGEKKPCTFCGLHNGTRKYRCKSPDRIYDELLALSDKYGVREFMLTDCVMPQNWKTELLPRLKESKVGLRLFQEVRPTLSPADVRLMAEAGFYRLQPGIESLNGHTLQLMNKGTTVLQNLRFLKACRKYGIHPSWNILYGFPGEIAEDYRQQTRLIPLLHHLTPPNGCAWLIYARNNEYTLHPEQYGLTLRPAELYDYICPDDERYRQDTAIYYTADQSIPQDIQSASRKLKEASLQWSGAHSTARLDAADLGSQCLIIDTRACRDLRAHLLLGTERRVFLCCDDIRARSALLSELSGSCTPEEIDSALQSLLAKKLLAKSGELYLSLAVLSDIETLKRKDIRDFQALYRSSAAFRELCRESFDRCGNGTEAITHMARRLNMCFDGQDYEKYAMPLSS